MHVLKYTCIDERVDEGMYLYVHELLQFNRTLFLILSLRWLSTMSDLDPSESIQLIEKSIKGE